MKIKAGVKLDKLQPQMALVLIQVERVWNMHGLEATLTSGNDGKHRTNSLHYQGLALDFRTRDLTDSKAQFFAEQVADALGSEFDIVLEFNPRHLHAEFDSL